MSCILQALEVVHKSIRYLEPSSTVASLFFFRPPIFMIEVSGVAVYEKLIVFLYMQKDLFNIETLPLLYSSCLMFVCFLLNTSHILPDVTEYFIRWVSKFDI